jgi:plastocyanin
MQMKRRWSRTATMVVLAWSIGMVVWMAPAAAGGGTCHSAPVTDTSTDRVYMAENCFTPTIVRIDIGDRVTWTNKDAVAHAVVGANGSWGRYEDISQGGTTAVRFDASGVYPYFCYIHPGMIGAVVVGNGERSAASGSAVVPVTPTPQPGATQGLVTDRPTADSSPAWKVATFVGFGLLLAVLVGLGVMWRNGPRREPQRNLGRSLS